MAYPALDDVGSNPLALVNSGRGEPLALGGKPLPKTRQDVGNQPMLSHAGHCCPNSQSSKNKILSAGNKLPCSQPPNK